MVLFDGAFGGLIVLAVWIFCIIDVITTPREQVRNLPKLAGCCSWSCCVDVGSIAWLVAGRPWNRGPMARPRRRRHAPAAARPHASARRRARAPRRARPIPTTTTTSSPRSPSVPRSNAAGPSGTATSRRTAPPT